MNSELDRAYCSLYVNLDAEPLDRLVANKPFYHSPFGPITVLQTLRLENASGIVVGGSISQLRSFLSLLAEADKSGELTISGDSSVILTIIEERATKAGLDIEYRQIGTYKEAVLAKVMPKQQFELAVTAMVLENLNKSRLYGINAQASKLTTSIRLDASVAILTVGTQAANLVSADNVTAWEFGATTVSPEGVYTSMVVHPSNLQFTSAGTLDLAWSLWVRTGRPWSYEERTKLG
jgi:hypothetical protein